MADPIYYTHPCLVPWPPDTRREPERSSSCLDHSPSRHANLELTDHSGSRAQQPGTCRCTGASVVSPILCPWNDSSGADQAQQHSSLCEIGTNERTLLECCMSSERCTIFVLAVFALMTMLLGCLSSACWLCHNNAWQLTARKWIPKSALELPLAFVTQEAPSYKDPAEAQ